MRKSNIVIIIIVVLIIAIIFAGIYFLTRKTNVPNIPVNTDQNQGTTTDATNTPITGVPAPVDQFPGWRAFENQNLGIYFRFPAEYLLKSEGYNANGNYTAHIGSNTSDIYITVAKTIQDIGTRLQSTSIKVAGKDALSYNTRKDTCDINVVQTDLDKNYKIQYQFESCGTAANVLFNDKATIAKILSSIQFKNANTALFVDTKLGLAFRYPTASGTPTLKTTSTSTLYIINKNTYISEGKDQALSTIIDNLKNKPNTKVEAVYVDDLSGYRVIVTPSSGAPERSIYVMHKANLLTVRSDAVDSTDFDTVSNSLRILTK